MNTVYTEVDFGLFEAVPGALYQALKSVPTAILYRECIDGKERFACIMFNDRNLPQVKKIADENGVKVDFVDVPQTRLLEVESGEVETLIDGYNTRNSKFWLGTFTEKQFERKPNE
jgi:hypothetical protein